MILTLILEERMVFRHKSRELGDQSLLTGAEVPSVDERRMSAHLGQPLPWMGQEYP